MSQEGNNNATMQRRIADICTTSTYDQNDVYDILKYIVDQVNSTSNTTASSDAPCCTQTEQLVLAARIVASKSNHAGPCLFKVHDLLTTALETMNSAGNNKNRSIALMDLLTALLDSASVSDTAPFLDNVLNTLCRKKGKAPLWFPTSPKSLLKADDSLLQAATQLFGRYVSHPAHVVPAAGNSNNSSVFAPTLSRSANNPLLLPQAQQQQQQQQTAVGLDHHEVKAFSSILKHIVTDNAGSINLSSAAFTALLLLARSPRTTGKEFAKWLHGMWLSSPATLEQLLRWLELAGRGDAKLSGEIVDFAARVCATMQGPLYSVAGSSSSSPDSILRVLLQQAYNNNVPLGSSAAAASSSSALSSVTSTPLFPRSVFVQAAACQLWQLLEVNFSDSTKIPATVHSYLALRRMLLCCLTHNIGQVPAEQVQLLPGLQALELVVGALNCDGKACTIVALLVSILDSTTAGGGSAGVAHNSNALRQLAAENCGLSSAEDLGPVLEVESTSSSPTSSNNNSGGNVRGVLLYALQRTVANITTLTDSTCELVIRAVRAVLLAPPKQQRQRGNSTTAKSGAVTTRTTSDNEFVVVDHQQQQQAAATVSAPTEIEVRACALLLLELSCRHPRPFPVVGQRFWTDVLGVISQFVEEAALFVSSSGSNSNGSRNNSTSIFAPSSSSSSGSNNNNNNAPLLVATSKRIASIASAVRCFNAAGADEAARDHAAVTGGRSSCSSGGSSSAAAAAASASDIGLVDDSFAALGDDGGAAGSDDVRKQVIRVFYESVSHLAFETLRHVQTPLSMGIPAATIAAALAYRSSGGGNFFSSQRSSNGSGQNGEEQQQNSGGGVAQWWEQAIDFLMLAGAPPTSARGAVAIGGGGGKVATTAKPPGLQQPQQQQQQPLSMSTMRACLSIVHESWQAKYRLMKKQQQQDDWAKSRQGGGGGNSDLDEEDSAFPRRQSQGSSSSNRRHHHHHHSSSSHHDASAVFFFGTAANGTTPAASPAFSSSAAATAATNATWITALANLVADSKVPVSVRADCLAMFSRLPSAHMATHFRSLIEPLANILVSSFVCSSAAVQELGHDPLLAHSSCWSVLPMCCAAVRVDGFSVVQREAARLHVRGLVPAQGLDAQHQLVSAAILTFSRVARLLPSFFRDIVTVHFDVFTKITNAQQQYQQQQQQLLAQGSSSSQHHHSSNKTAGSKTDSSIGSNSALLSVVNRATVLINTLTSLCRSLRAYCGAVESRTVVAPDNNTLGLLLEQLLGKAPAAVLVPHALSHPADLATCILSARCCGLIATHIPALASRTVQVCHQSPHVMLSLVLRECARGVVAVAASRGGGGGSSPSSPPSSNDHHSHHSTLLTSVVSLSNSLLSQHWTAPWLSDKTQTPIPVLAALQALVECIPDHGIEPLLGAAVQSLVAHLLSTTTITTTSHAAGGKSSSSAAATSAAPAVAPAAQMGTIPAAFVAQLLWAGIDNQWLPPAKFPHVQSLAHALVSCAFFRVTSPLLGPTSSNLFLHSMGGLCSAASPATADSATSAAMTLMTKYVSSHTVFEFAARLLCANPLAAVMGSVPHAVLERCKVRLALAVAWVPFSLLSNNARGGSGFSLTQKQQRVIFLLSLIASEPSRSANRSLCGSLDLLLTRLLTTTTDAAECFKIVQSLKDLVRLRPSRIAATVATTTAVDSGAAEAPSGGGHEQSYKGDGDMENDGDDDAGSPRRRRGDASGAPSAASALADAAAGGVLLPASTLERLCPGVAEWSAKLAILRSVRQIILVHATKRSWWNSQMMRLVCDTVDTLIGTVAGTSTCSSFVVPLLHLIFASSPVSVATATTAGTPAAAAAESATNRSVKPQQQQQQEIIAELPTALLGDSAFSLAAALRRVFEDGPAPTAQLRQLLEALLQWHHRDASLTNTLLGRIASPIGVWVGRSWNSGFCCKHSTETTGSSSASSGGGVSQHAQQHSAPVVVGSPGGSKPTSIIFVPPRETEKVAVDAVFCLLQLCAASRKIFSSAASSNSNAAGKKSCDAFLVQIASVVQATLTSTFGLWDTVAEALVEELFAAQTQQQQQQQAGRSYDALDDEIAEDDDLDSAAANGGGGGVAASNSKQRQQQHRPGAATSSSSLATFGNAYADDDDDDTADSVTRALRWHLARCRQEALVASAAAAAESHQSWTKTRPWQSWSLDALACLGTEFLDLVRRARGPETIMSRTLTTLWVALASQVVAGETSLLTNPPPLLSLSSFSSSSFWSTAGRAAAAQFLNSGHDRAQRSREVLADCGQLLRDIVAPGAGTELRPDVSVCTHLSDILVSAVSSRAATWSMAGSGNSGSSSSSSSHNDNSSPSLLSLCLAVSWYLQPALQIETTLMVLQAAATRCSCRRRVESTAAASSVVLLDDAAVRSTLAALKRSGLEQLRQSRVSVNSARRHKKSTSEAATTAATTATTEAVAECLLYLSCLSAADGGGGNAEAEDSSLIETLKLWATNAADVINTLHLHHVFAPQLFDSLCSGEKNAAFSGGGAKTLFPARIAWLAACASSSAHRLELQEHCSAFGQCLVAATEESSKPLFSSLEAADELAHLFSACIFGQEAANNYHKGVKEVKLLRAVTVGVVQAVASGQHKKQQQQKQQHLTMWIVRFLLRLLLPLLQTAAAVAGHHHHHHEQQQQQQQQQDQDHHHHHEQHSSHNHDDRIITLHETVAAFMATVAALMQCVPIDGDDAATATAMMGLLRNAFNYAAQNHPEEARAALSTGTLSEQTVRVLKSAVAPPPAAETTTSPAAAVSETQQQQPQQTGGGGLRINLSSWS